ncbi:hypothetical protein GN956_G6504 [Arapaima gigas]
MKAEVQNSPDSVKAETAEDEEAGPRKLEHKYTWWSHPTPQVLVLTSGTEQRAVFSRCTSPHVGTSGQQSGRQSNATVVPAAR